MTIHDFQIGLDFIMGGCPWRCTDIGSRTICAIELDKDDDSWYVGPPYAVSEYVIDENAMEDCYKDLESYYWNFYE